METYYRATLKLERVEPYINKYDSPDTRSTEVAEITVTGDTAADAMYQITSHADSLHQWHDEPSPEPVVHHLDVLDVPVPPGAFGRLMQRLHDGTPCQCQLCEAMRQKASAAAEPAAQDDIGELPDNSCGDIYPVDGNRPDHTCALDREHIGHHSSGDFAWDNDGEPDELDRASVAKLAAEQENRCAYCSQVIALVGNTWYHDVPEVDIRDGHAATPANLASL